MTATPAFAQAAARPRGGSRSLLALYLACLLIGLALAPRGAPAADAASWINSVPEPESIGTPDDAQQVLDRLDGWRRMASDDRDRALRDCAERVFSNRCREQVESAHRQLAQRLRVVELRAGELLREERNRQQAAARAERDAQAAERVQAARDAEPASRARAAERQARQAAREQAQSDREREAAQRATRAAARAEQRQAREQQRADQDPRRAP